MPEQAEKSEKSLRRLRGRVGAIAEHWHEADAGSEERQIWLQPRRMGKRRANGLAIFAARSSRYAIVERWRCTSSLS